MDASRASMTAMAAAFFRAYHHRYDDPKIFDDPLAEALLPDMDSIGNDLLARGEKNFPDVVASSADRQQALARVLRHMPAPATVLSRGRYAEDRLLDAMKDGVRQYVLVGAGLETFAFRRTDLRDRLEIFELDHPATQAFKKQALSRADIPVPPNLHFVAVDLETVAVADALHGTAFDPNTATVFSWQGVVVYLTVAAIRETLRSIRTVSAPRSLVLLSYMDGDAFREDRVSARIRQNIQMMKNIGEPYVTGFDPPVLRKELLEAGFEVVEDIGTEEQERRYFSARKDGYHATEHVRFACAIPSTG